MNALRNKVQLIGHLGAKVELKTLESGKVVGNVNLATNESYKNQKGERVTETYPHVQAHPYLVEFSTSDSL